MWPFGSSSSAPAAAPAWDFEAEARKFELSFQMETMATLMTGVRRADCREREFFPANAQPVCLNCHNVLHGWMTL
jgi:hypothetical protein